MGNINISRLEVLGQSWNQNSPIIKNFNQGKEKINIKLWKVSSLIKVQILRIKHQWDLLFFNPYHRKMKNHSEELKNKEVGYAFRSSSFALQFSLGTNHLTMTLINNRNGDIFSKIFTENDEIGKGIIDPQDLMLIFLSVDKMQSLIENSPHKEVNENHFNFNQMQTNGKNSFIVMENGMIWISQSFFKGGNKMREHRCEFILHLEKQKTVSVSTVKNQNTSRDEELQQLRRQCEEKVLNVQRKFEQKMLEQEKRFSDLIVKQEEKLRKQMSSKGESKKQISYQEAKRKYIDDLCD